MKINRLLSLLIIFVALLSFLFLMNKKTLSPSLSSQLLNLTKIKEDNEIFSERIIFFYKGFFFSFFVIILAFYFFLRVFLNIDRFHLEEKKETTLYLIEEDYKLIRKKERLRKIIQLQHLRMRKRILNKFFDKWKSIKKLEKLKNFIQSREDQDDERRKKIFFNKYKTITFYIPDLPVVEEISTLKEQQVMEETKKNKKKV